MLTYNFRQLFKQRGIDMPYRFLVKGGVSPKTATAILNGKLGTIRLDHIEVVCEILNCTPNDLLAWTPGKNQQISDDHALRTLKREEGEIPLAEVLKTMSISKLKELSLLIKKES